MVLSKNHLIVGPGAIGALTCAAVQHAGDVFVYQHRPLLSLASSLQAKSAVIPLTWRLTESAQTPEPSFIWACCKANQVESTLVPLLERWPNAHAVLLHNGMGPQQSLKQRFGTRIIIGSTTCGALKLADGNFRQTSFGQTQISLDPNNPDHAWLQQSVIGHTSDNPLNFQINTHIEQVLWRKVAINAVINPITAYHQVRNGQLLTPPYREDVEQLATEIDQLLAALGQDIGSKLQDLVFHIAEISSDNRSSMAEDVANGRVSENDFITGFLLNQAEGVNLPAPLLKKWYKRLDKLDQQHRHKPR